MKTASLIRALEKEGFKVQQNQQRNSMYFCEGDINVIEWYDQEGTAMCVKVRRHNDKDDMYSDYCAGFFCKTIKSAIRWFKE